MNSELTSALAAIVKRLATLAEHDPHLRQDMRRLAEALLMATAEAPATAGGHMALLEASVDLATSDDQPTLPLASATTDLAEPVPTPLPELTLGRGRPPEETPARTWRSAPLSPSADLGLIEERCRLKAEGARWAARRRRRIAEGADFRTEIEPKDRDIIARAKALPECYLWMNHTSAPSTDNLAGYETVAGCFEAAAESLAIIRQVVGDADAHREIFEQALDLAAEAQSALRASISQIDAPNDPDQSQIFSWLRTTASEHQIFIQRHMRADDPAPPGAYAELSTRIFALDSRLQESRKRVKQRRKLMGKVHHKSRLIGENPGGDHAESWRILAETVDELVQDGLPVSHVELRECLLPLVDFAPDLGDAHIGFQRVMREIDRYLALSPTEEATAVGGEPTPAVREAAALLEGKCMVLIGGDRRPGAQRALKEALRLSDLVWLETREHQSIAGFEPAIARPDVALCVLAIRWTSHSFGDVKTFCDRYGKPLVRLPAGYNPNQVAAQIVAQCSGRLKAG
jgi:hypothetical protein